MSRQKATTSIEDAVAEYDDLIKSLRICDSEDISCSECSYCHRDQADHFVKFCGILGAAANALEYSVESIGELVETVEGLEKKLGECEEVVRCYQCRYWGQSSGWCEIFRKVINDPEFYCKDGERDTMRELLDRQTVIDNVLEQMSSSSDQNAMRERLMCLDAADARPVVHWIS